MPKDSQTDPKPVRKAKSNGGPTSADQKQPYSGRNSKKQSITAAPEGGIPDNKESNRHG